MLDFMMNNKEYEIQANMQLSSVLSQFDSTYIMNVIDDTLTKSLNSFDLFGPPNAVDSFENIFLEMGQVYPEEAERIQDSRREVYREIIERICFHMQLQYNINEEEDIYTIARTLYDFFVTHLNRYIVDFYTRYIISQKEEIYNNFHLEDMRKNKDMGTVYSKMAFGDGDAIALIVANLPKVMSIMREMAVSDEFVYDTVYGPAQRFMTDLLLEHFNSNNSIFALFNKILFHPQLYPTIITHIRMSIQQVCRADINAAMSDIAANSKGEKK